MIARKPIVYGRKPILNVDDLRQTWSALANKYSGSIEGVRFTALLHGIADWDGKIDAPISIKITRA